MVFVPHAVTEIPQTSSNASTKWSVLSREPIDWYAQAIAAHARQAATQSPCRLKA
jgi:hypothetical protein